MNPLHTRLWPTATTIGEALHALRPVPGYRLDAVIEQRDAAIDQFVRHAKSCKDVDRYARWRAVPLDWERGRV